MSSSKASMTNRTCSKTHPDPEWLPQCLQHPAMTWCQPALPLGLRRHRLSATRATLLEGLHPWLHAKHSCGPLANLALEDPTATVLGGAVEDHVPWIQHLLVLGLVHGLPMSRRQLSLIGNPMSLSLRQRLCPHPSRLQWVSLSRRNYDGTSPLELFPPRTLFSVKYIGGGYSGIRGGIAASCSVFGAIIPSICGGSRDGGCPATGWAREGRSPALLAGGRGSAAGSGRRHAGDVCKRSHHPLECGIHSDP